MARLKPSKEDVYSSLILFTDRLKRFVRGFDRTIRLFVRWCELCIFGVDQGGHFWRSLSGNSTYSQDYSESLRKKYY